VTHLSRIVVAGGTGFVGRSLCAAFAAQGALPRLLVPTRRRVNGRSLGALPNVDVVEADVHDPAALPALLQGADALVNLVAILHGSEAAFDRTHVQLPRTLAQACRQAAVRRVVHVSALGVGLQAPSLYLRSKAAGEAVWQQSGLDVTLLRPSVIFGADDRFTNLFASLQRVAPVLPLAGAKAQFQPVWVGDVAQAVITSLARPGTIGQTIECAGPEVLTLAEIVRRSGRGHARPVLPLPEGLAMLQAAAMEWLPGEPLMSRDNVRSMRVPNVAGGQLPGLASLGIEARRLPG
jgi:uncharacterized protein YbjT (DUF2867 family)